MLLALVPPLAGCDRLGGGGQPPRSNDSIEVEAAPSLISVPVEADLADLANVLEREVPQQLWAIDKPDQTCVKSKGLDIGIATIKTPKLKCHIIGSVTRGPMRLEGAGREIRIAMPLHASIRTENVAGIIDETATADAVAHAVIRLDIAQDWTPRGKVDITYDWRDAPHIDFMGQRIDIAQDADRKLGPVIAKMNEMVKH